MGAALRIVLDVLVYRLRRLEMANMVAAVAIMLALRTPWTDLAIRSVFALVLNVLAYLTNDYCDVHRDLAGGRAPKKTEFLRDHMGAALGAQLALGALLVAIAAAHDLGLLVPGILGALLCWVYSAKLKITPYADIAAMIAWGVIMPLVAFPLDHRLGWLLVTQLALFSACFETIQVIRDHDEDRAAGIETTAVRLGPKRSLALARTFMVLSAVYATLVLHRYLGPALLVAPLLPFQPGDESKYWTRIRLVMGLVWLGMLVTVYVTKAPFGVWRW